MELTRRGFIQGAAAGAAVVAVASVVAPAVAAPGSALISPAPVTAVAFHQILGAVRDVYSAEIYMRALPVYRFDQFTTREGEILTTPDLSSIQRLPPTAFEGVNRRTEELTAIQSRIQARVAVEMDRKRSRAAMFSSKKRRTYFDFGWLRA